MRSAVERLSESIQVLIAGLTGELSKATPDRVDDSRATAVTNLAQASRDAASEQELLTTLLTKQSDTTDFVPTTATEIAQVVASQNTALGAAMLTAAPDQSSRISALKAG